MKVCEHCKQPLPETLEEKVARLEKEITELKAKPEITIYPPYYPTYPSNPYWQELPYHPWDPNTHQTWCDATGWRHVAPCCSQYTAQPYNAARLSATN